MKRHLYYTVLLMAMMLAGCWAAWGIEKMSLWGLPGFALLMGLLRLTCWSLEREGGKK